MTARVCRASANTVESDVISTERSVGDLPCSHAVPRSLRARPPPRTGVKHTSGQALFPRLDEAASPRDGRSASARSQLLNDLAQIWDV